MRVGSRGSDPNPGRLRRVKEARARVSPELLGPFPRGQCNIVGGVWHGRAARRREWIMRLRREGFSTKMMALVFGVSEFAIRQQLEQKQQRRQRALSTPLQAEGEHG